MSEEYERGEISRAGKRAIQNRRWGLSLVTIPAIKKAALRVIAQITRIR